MLEEILQVLKGKYSEKEVDIFVERFGLVTHQLRTFLSLSEQYGMTIEDVRQIEAKIVSYLKRHFHEREEELQAFLCKDINK